MTLGNFIKSNDIGGMENIPSLATIEEFPLEAFMAGDVRFRRNSVLDELEEYITSRLDELEKYNANPNHNEKHLAIKRKEQARLENIANRLRKDKVELWLHVMPYVREYIRENGDVGTLRIVLPVRHDIEKTINIDFVNNKMMVF